MPQMEALTGQLQFEVYYLLIYTCVCVRARVFIHSSNINGGLLFSDPQCNLDVYLCEVYNHLLLLLQTRCFGVMNIHFSNMFLCG